jgi:hypothetical protein
LSAQHHAALTRPRCRPIERRFAGYAVTSGAILAAAGQADAGIVYSGIRDVPVGNQQTVNLNVNDTGPLADTVTDYIFKHLNVINGLNQTITLETIPQGSNKVVTSGGFAAALDMGAIISSADTLGGGTLTMAQYKYKLNSLQSSSGPWRGADNKYLGLYFEIPGDGFHFGWARLSVSAAPTTTAEATIHDWAYETTPDTAILAGATSVPEPSSLTLGVLALGAVGVAALVRSRARGASAPAG